MQPTRQWRRTFERKQVKIIRIALTRFLVVSLFVIFWAAMFIAAIFGFHPETGGLAGISLIFSGITLAILIKGELDKEEKGG